METPVQSEVQKSVRVSPILLNTEKGIYEGTYQKAGTSSVELRQSVTTIGMYPSKRATNDMNGSLFSSEEFGFATQEYSNTEQRVAWINVPSGTTLEQVQAKIAAAPEAVIYKVLSNKPILTSDQNYAIASGSSTKTLEDYANSQVVRYPAMEGSNPHPKAGQIVLHNGKVQYRSTFFSPVAKKDQDLRTPEMDEFFASEEILAELRQGGNATVISGQGLN